MTKNEALEIIDMLSGVDFNSMSVCCGRGIRMQQLKLLEEAYSVLIDSFGL